MPQFVPPNEDHYMNISCYKFVEIPDREKLREDIKAHYKKECAPNDTIRGSIYLSTEGTNINCSGKQKDIIQWKAFLRGIRPYFKDLYFKDTDGGKEHNYRKMRVRMKDEIITMGRKDIVGKDIPRIKPKELQDLLEKDKVVVVDVRNDYEQSLGTFKNAVKCPINTFGSFPSWAKELKENHPEYLDKTIVTVCTGGIKTEKSTCEMKDLGFNAKLLDGGILQYFIDIDEEKKKAYYEGDCFVFDRRVAVQPDLLASKCVLCEACTKPLTYDDQQLPSYEEGKCCKYCKYEPKRKLFVPADISKDPNAPEKPLDAERCYLREQHQLDSKVDKETLRAQWKDMDYQQRKQYIEASAKSKEDYQQRVKDYLIYLSDQDLKAQTIKLEALRQLDLQKMK
mmetsp:Transcript_245/g.438  ORF Transcript_245/g.438 Transcript_245/m.438 type:complete len:396 (+) Transcript_245:77-1264(+)